MQEKVKKLLQSGNTLCKHFSWHSLTWKRYMDYFTLDSVVVFIFKMFSFKNNLTAFYNFNLCLYLLSFLKFYGCLDCQLKGFFSQMLNEKWTSNKLSRVKRKIEKKPLEVVTWQLPRHSTNTKMPKQTMKRK